MAVAAYIEAEVSRLIFSTYLSQSNLTADEMDTWRRVRANRLAVVIGDTLTLITKTVDNEPLYPVYRFSAEDADVTSDNAAIRASEILRSRRKRRETSFKHYEYKRRVTATQRLPFFASRLAYASCELEIARTRWTDLISSIL